MNRYFGSVPKSCFTIFASIAGGITWSDVSDVLADVSLFYAAMFVSFQALSLIVVMDLITGIFVDNAIRTDADITLEAEVREQQNKDGTCFKCSITWTGTSQIHLRVRSSWALRAILLWLSTSRRLM